MKQNEEWRPVVDWEDEYEVSSTGRVRGIDRVLSPDGLAPRKWSGIELSRCSDTNSYPLVILHKAGCRRTRQVHRLVLEAFVGRRPLGKEARHLDGVRTNNNIKNLEWATHADNEADKDKHGTRIQGEDQWKSKLTEDQVEQIYVLRKDGLNYPEIASKFDVTPENIGYVVRGETWKHVHKRVFGR